ncbi:MAG: hypothetical protein WKF36_06120 [Candidatus Nitrosocosmicus sp.]
MNCSTEHGHGRIGAMPMSFTKQSPNRITRFGAVSAGGGLDELTGFTNWGYKNYSSIYST